MRPALLPRDVHDIFDVELAGLDLSTEDGREALRGRLSRSLRFCRVERIREYTRALGAPVGPHSRSGALRALAQAFINHAGTSVVK